MALEGAKYWERSECAVASMFGKLRDPYPPGDKKSRETHTPHSIYGPLERRHSCPRGWIKEQPRNLGVNGNRDKN